MKRLWSWYIATIVAIHQNAKADNRYFVSDDLDRQVRPKRTQSSWTDIQLRGSERQQQLRTHVRRKALQGDDDFVTIFILLLFGSQNAALTSWSLAQETEESEADIIGINSGTSFRTLVSASIGHYSSSTTDTTELIRLSPGHYYQFNVSDDSDTDSTGIDYTIVLSEPAFSLASGQVLAGTTASVSFYLPMSSEVVGNLTMPSAEPSQAPSIDCAGRGDVCLSGSDCCSNRCSPENFVCYPKRPDVENGDREKLPESAGGAASGEGVNG